MSSRLSRLCPILFFIVIGALIVYQSSLLDVEMAQNMGGVLGPAAYPKLLGILMLGLSFLFIYKGWPSEAETQNEQQELSATKPAYHLTILSFIGLLVLTYLLEFLGFIVASILLMMWFMVMMGERRWLFLTLSSIVFPLVVFSVFRYGFGIVFPEGILLTWIR